MWVKSYLSWVQSHFMWVKSHLTHCSMSYRSEMLHSLICIWICIDLYFLLDSGFANLDLGTWPMSSLFPNRSTPEVWFTIHSTHVHYLAVAPMLSWLFPINNDSYKSYMYNAFNPYLFCCRVTRCSADSCLHAFYLFSHSAVTSWCPVGSK